MFIRDFLRKGNTLFWNTQKFIQKKKNRFHVNVSPPLRFQRQYDFPQNLMTFHKILGLVMFLVFLEKSCFRQRQLTFLLYMHLGELFWVFLSYVSVSGSTHLKIKILIIELKKLVLQCQYKLLMKLTTSLYFVIQQCPMF